MQRLENKVALITGAGSGIGQGIALEFHRQGARVALLDINRESLDDTAKQMGANPEECLTMQGDIRKLPNVKACVEQAIATFGKIDVLVNNAGIYKMLELLDTDDADWNETITVNLTGPFLLMRQVVPYMIKNNSGKIINIASTAALRAFPNSAAYTASKGGLLALSRQLAMELAPHQINVNTICPGIIRTPILEDLLSDPERKQALESCQPIGRLGTPQDIARCCVYLASEDSDFVSGDVISVDGAWVTTLRGN